MAQSVLHTPLEFPSNVYQIVSADCVNVISGVCTSQSPLCFTHAIFLVAGKVPQKSPWFQEF